MKVNRGPPIFMTQIKPPPEGLQSMAQDPEDATPEACWEVYMLRCADGSLYTGIARDAARRLREHNGLASGGARYTRGRRPVSLVYREPAADRSVAARREAEIKRMSRSAKEALIASLVRPSGG